MQMRRVPITHGLSNKETLSCLIGIWKCCSLQKHARNISPPLKNSRRDVNYVWTSVQLQRIAGVKK